MPDHLGQASPRQSSSTEESTIQKVDTFSITAESDGETTLSMTSSEDWSPTSNIRNVSAQMNGKRASRTSIPRPVGYSPVKRASKKISQDGASSRKSGVLGPTSDSPTPKENAPNHAFSPRLATKRASASSKRNSGGWDALARKSAGYRNSASTGSVSSARSSKKKSTSKGNAKDELIAKLNKQVEMLQEKQKKIDSVHQERTQNLEARLEDLRVADSVVISQLRNERNDLKEELDEANNKIQSMGEDQELVIQKELATKRAMEQQLAEAHARIQKLSEQAMDDHFGGSKIDLLRERRRAIEAQMAGASGANGDAEKVQQSQKPQNNDTQSQSPIVEKKSKPTDVDMEAVIKNLQDELQASKQVIVQQKEQLRLVLEIQENDEKKSNTSSDGWKARFLELQQRHLKLECDRAWSEFKLRNRITADSLKFNRRLNHWKQQVQDLETKLDTLQMVRDRIHGAQEVPQVEAPTVDDDSGVDKSTTPPPRRGWWGRR